MHERSTDPDVVKRLQAEIEWAVKARRRYVELIPDDAVALQARITDCPSCAQMKQWYGPDGDRGALKARVTELEYERDALKAQLRLEVVHCGEFQLLTAKFDAENLELRDQAGEMAEELAFLRGEAALIERDQARVEVLTAALTEILELIEHQDRPVARIKVRARAALAKGAKS